MKHLESIGLDTDSLTLGDISSVQFKAEMGEEGEASTDEVHPQESTEIV